MSEKAAAVAGALAGTLRHLVQQSVEHRKAEALLLSAGLDTAIIATAAAAAGHRPLAVTVCWDAGAPDYGYATELAARLELTHHVVWAGGAELMAAMPEVINVLRTFDPMELRNSVVQHVGLVRVSAQGARSCYVGDAADELFAGYSYMVRMAPEALAAYSRELAGFMRFSAGRLGEALGVDVVSPYLDREIVDFAVELSPAQKVGDHLGERHGKWLLRLAFADDLPERFTWRTKTPAEYGSGSTRLRDAALARLDEDAFVAVCQAAGAEGVRLRDREQAFYYRLFREVFPAPRSLDAGAPKRCPECQGPAPDSRSRYCAICGAYPI